MDLGLREDFISLTPKARKIKAKISEWNYIKLKSFAEQKKLPIKQKATDQMGDDICKQLQQGLIAKIYIKNSYNSTPNKQSN